MTEIDVPLLRKTLEWALSEHRKAERGEPSEWDQGEWLGTIRETTWARFARSEPLAAYSEIERKVEAWGLSTACGTSCCIAGKIVLDAGYKPALHAGSTAAVISPSGEYRRVQDAATELLGNPATDRLFSAGNKIRDLYLIAGEMTDGEITMPAELVDEG